MGMEFTVTVIVALFVHPLAPVPVTVYAVVAPGRKDAPLVIPPVHAYEVAPVPLSVTVVPAQTDEEGVALAPTFGARLGLLAMLSDDDVPFPQELDGVTVIFPEDDPNCI
jgi:hypothetical protein